MRLDSSHKRAPRPAIGLHHQGAVWLQPEADAVLAAWPYQRSRRFQPVPGGDWIETLGLPKCRGVVIVSASASGGTIGVRSLDANSFRIGEAPYQFDNLSSVLARAFDQIRRYGTDGPSN